MTANSKIKEVIVSVKVFDENGNLKKDHGVVAHHKLDDDNELKQIEPELTGLEKLKKMLSKLFN